MLLTRAQVMPFASCMSTCAECVSFRMQCCVQGGCGGAAVAGAGDAFASCMSTCAECISYRMQCCVQGGCGGAAVAGAGDVFASCMSTCAECISYRMSLGQSCLVAQLHVWVCARLGLARTVYTPRIFGDFPAKNTV